MHRSLTILILAALTLPTGAAVQAQASFAEVSATGAWNSPFPTVEGTRRREFGFAALRGGWQIKGDETRTLFYFAEAVPVAVMTHDPVAYKSVPCFSGNPKELCLSGSVKQQTVLAAGVTPLGLRFRRKRANRVSILGDAAGGTLIFTHPVPDPHARRFNFTGSAGTSLELGVTTGTAVSVGYLWHHTSNGGTAKANPGLNSHMLRLALLRTKY